VSFLLDTNVVSELRKPVGRIDENVVSWAATLGSEQPYVSVMTLLEVQLGILLVERRDEVQGRRLRRWFDQEVLVAFADRTLQVDVKVALRAAELHVPDPRPERDALIAATALVHGLTVATRNVDDFVSTGVAVVDPWAR